MEGDVDDPMESKEDTVVESVESDYPTGDKDAKTVGRI